MNRSLAASGSVNLNYCSDALEALQFFNIAGAMKSIISGARNTRGRAQLLRLCLFATLWTVACQASLSMGFSRQGYWSGLPCPSPGDLPHSGIEHTSPVLAGGFFTTEPPEKPHISDFFFKTQIGMLVHTHTHTHTNESYYFRTEAIRWENQNSPFLFLHPFLFLAKFCSRFPDSLVFTTLYMCVF